MTGSSQLLDLLALIGSDSYLTRAELPDPDVWDCATQAWDLYASEFGGFTASQLDPLFHGLDNPAGQIGRPCLSLDDTVLVIGTGPSLFQQAEDLRRIRDRVHIFTSHRGAEALSRLGVKPDLVLVQHPSALDAEISCRQQGITGGLRVLAEGVRIAVEERTPAALIPENCSSRVFVPEKLCGWGLWPASAAGLAIEAGAGRIGLLGIDLGSCDLPDPAHRPLAGLLRLIAAVRPASCFDCGITGAVKPGWPKAPLPESASGCAAGLLRVEIRPRDDEGTRRMRLVEGREALQPILAEARAGLRIALEARTSPDGRGAEMAALIERILSWRQPLELRVRLQDTLGLSFLPRLWRSGVEGLSPHRLWRPAVLALDEICRQAENLRCRLAERPGVFRGASWQAPSADAKAAGDSGLSNGPEVLVLPVTYACNARCEMCTIWRRADLQTVSTRVLRQRLDGLGDSLEVVNLTGGEPFLRKDLPEIVAMLVERCPRLREVGIPTNGSMPERTLDQVRRICGLLHQGTSLAVILSIDGKAETHDRIRGTPGLYERAIRTVHLLVEETRGRENLSVGINMTITPANLPDIPALEQVAEGIGTGLILTPAVDSDIFINSRSVRADWAYRQDGWKDVADAICDFAGRHGDEGLEDASRVLKGAQRRSPCVFWGHGAFLDTDGSLFVCPVSSRGRFGSADGRGSAAAAWGSAEHRAALAELRSRDCVSCVSNCMASEADRADIVKIVRAQQRRIIIFGAGSGGRKALQHLRKAGVPVQAFVDNRARDNGRGQLGIPVLPWDHGSCCRNAFVVIASSTGGNQIAGQLDALGLAAGRDYVRYF